MIEIALKNIKKYYGGNEIIKDISLEVIRGEKVGIVGVNGSGKTTLFKIITGNENHDQGTLAISKGAVLGYLDQIPVFSDGVLVSEVLEMAFQEEFKLLKEIRALEQGMAITTGKELDRIMKQYADLHDLYTFKGGYEIEERISKVCTGLKITEEFKGRQFNSLSGGEKTTVMLGKILLQTCNVLLLDEPSNHLDMESIEWLEGYLRDYRGTVVIISHDRYFLDRVVNKIIEVEAGEAEIYHGNYSYFVEEKNRRLLEAMNAYKNQEKKLKSMEESIKRLRQWGIQGDNEKFFKKAASIQKRLDKIERLKKPIMERKKAQLQFNAKDRSGKDVISMKGVNKSFDGEGILSSLDMELSYGEKVAILGKNGCGKTTLIKVITGQYSCEAGEVKIGSNVKIGYLEQNIVFPNEGETILGYFRDKYPCNEGVARSILSKYLFYGEDVFKKLGSLSGGEKSRLRLCQLIYDNVNTLILDEPTNHLDIESREMLEESLDDFKGTVLFISHDRYFVNGLAEKVMLLNDGKITEYQGNYDYYKEKCKDEASIGEKKNQICTKKKESLSKPKVIQTNKVKPQEKIEIEIEELEQIISSIEVKMQSELSLEQLQTLQNEKEELQNKLDLLLEAWVGA
ncbi:ABC-F family ATP-binding cassette domain-containing protein [Alkalicella caledoniensis]|uniref:ABC-F family ATP-binding cassette domain-containing protein n=1 Tax=Alkalicella caledoniensis TaxID=2731377 RepID=A0A7G9W8S7_ALKCA|nr:ABC-F family ATP-binding cassette domain-containing protein [Alkalicella caledoniensis]QNO15089.1 ABC-F family ATP-binding cassette domain-containing protein [Alkalicella caledoniensis]